MKILRSEPKSSKSFEKILVNIAKFGFIVKKISFLFVYVCVFCDTFIPFLAGEFFNRNKIQTEKTTKIHC